MTIGYPSEVDSPGGPRQAREDRRIHADAQAWKKNSLFLMKKKILFVFARANLSNLLLAHANHAPGVGQRFGFGASMLYIAVLAPMPSARRVTASIAVKIAVLTLMPTARPVYGESKGFHSGNSPDRNRAS